MRGKKISPYHTTGYPLPFGFNGLLAAPYRWFSGRPMNGHRYTDATFWRYGTMSMDPSGHASGYHLLPGRLRFAYFRLPIMLAPGYVALWFVDIVRAILVTVAMIVLATWRMDMWRRRRRFRGQVIEPVDAAVATALHMRRDAGRGHTRVDIPVDFRDDPEAKITIRLPMDFIGQDGDKAALVRAVAAKLAMDELTPTWTLQGHTPSVTLHVPPAPPSKINLAEAFADADAADDGAVVVGYGARGRPELFSLVAESPHLLINGGSGAGKSVFLAWLAGQFMRRGYGIVVLDAKFVSHMWLRRVPGVHYAAEAAELHDALVWLDAELLRRARFVAKASDVDAAAATLIPLFVILEEINGASNRLRTYWKTIKGPEDMAMSPALTALANLANMGRELRVHVAMAGQSLTAKATGGPEGRESFGGRALARATANAWRMLAPQIKPAPVKRGRPGRWHLVVGDSLREFQVPFVDLKTERGVAALLAWASGGADIPDVSAMIAGWEMEEEDQPEVCVGRSEASSPALDPTLSEYAAERGVDLAWLRRQIERRPEAPVVVSVGAKGARRYDREDLDAFVAQRLREPAAAGGVD